MRGVALKLQAGDRFRKIVSHEITEGYVVERCLVVTETEITLFDKKFTNDRVSFLFVSALQAISVDTAKRKIILYTGDTKVELIFQSGQDMGEFGNVLIGYFSYDELFRKEFACLRQFGKARAPDWRARFRSVAALHELREIPDVVMEVIRSIACLITDSISFGESPILARFFVPILKIANCLTNLKSIGLKNGLDFSYFPTFLENSMSVRELVFEGELPGEVLMILDFVQNRTSSIKDLAWKHVRNMGPDVVQKLAEVVKSGKVEKLSFDGVMDGSDLANFFQMSGPGSLSSFTIANVSNLAIDAALPVLCQIESVALQYSGLDIPVFLAKIEKVSTCKIRVLDLSGNKFSQAKLVIPHNLTNLKLRDVTFSGKSLRNFLKAFIKSPGPLCCDVSHAQAQKWKQILRVFDKLTPSSLVEFRWDGNPSSSSFFRFLEKCTALSTLSVCGNDQLDFSLLDKAVCKLPNLERLYMKGKPSWRMQRYAVKFLNDIKQSHTLTTLDISGHGIDREGINQLGVLIAETPSLQDVTCDEADVYDSAEWTKFLEKVESGRTQAIKVRPPVKDFSRIVGSYELELRFVNLSMIGSYEAEWPGFPPEPEDSSTLKAPEEEEVRVEQPKKNGSQNSGKSSQSSSVYSYYSATSTKDAEHHSPAAAARTDEPPAAAGGPPRIETMIPPVVIQGEGADIQESTLEPEKQEEAKSYSTATFSDSQRELKFARNRTESNFGLAAIVATPKKLAESHTVFKVAQPAKEEVCSDGQPDEPASSSTQEVDSFKVPKQQRKPDGIGRQLEDINLINQCVRADRLVAFSDLSNLRRGRIGGRRLPTRVTFAMPENNQPVETPNHSGKVPNPEIPPKEQPLPVSPAVGKTGETPTANTQTSVKRQVVHDSLANGRSSYSYYSTTNSTEPEAESNPVKNTAPQALGAERKKTDESAKNSNSNTHARDTDKLENNQQTTVTEEPKENEAEKGVSKKSQNENGTADDREYSSKQYSYTYSESAGAEPKESSKKRSSSYSDSEEVEPKGSSKQRSSKDSEGEGAKPKGSSTKRSARDSDRQEAEPKGSSTKRSARDSDRQEAEPKGSSTKKSARDSDRQEAEPARDSDRQEAEPKGSSTKKSARDSDRQEAEPKGSVKQRSTKDSDREGTKPTASSRQKSSSYSDSEGTKPKASSTKKSARDSDRQEAEPKRRSRKSSSKERSRRNSSSKKPSEPERPTITQEKIDLKQRFVIEAFQNPYSSDSDADNSQEDIDKDRIMKAKPVNWSPDLPVLPTASKRKVMTMMKKKYSIANLIRDLSQTK